MSENPQGKTVDNSTLSDEVNIMLKDFIDFAILAGRAAGKAAEDLTGLMVVKVGAGERADLDIMVDSGLAKTRAEAALRLMTDGIKANRPLYEHAERTREQIQALRGQLKEMLGKA